MLGFQVKNLLRNIKNKSINCTIYRTKSTIDPIQAKSLEEKCFLVDKNDKIIGQATKRVCHTVDKDGKIPLHRAFSVFLFNKSGDLLLQKRSASKVTYPDCYTNSCCSHPIENGEGEDDGVNGIKKAAQRRLNIELGIPKDKIPLENFKYITRIHYKDVGNGRWGEHEIDYVLFLQDNLPIKPNSNEISEISYVPRASIDEHIPTLSNLTPWFQLILKYRLKLWWDNLDDLTQIEDHTNIQNFHKIEEVDEEVKAAR